MLLTWKLVTVFLIFFLVGNGYGKFENRILYGKVVDPDDLGWSIVEIKSKDAFGNNFTCTGTLISDRHILTARHCVEDLSNLRRRSVLYFNLFKHNQPHQNLTIYTRPDGVDIAIIEFPEGTIFDEHAYKIALSGDYMDESSYQYLINRTAIIAGYGIYDYDRNSHLGGIVKMRDGKLRIAKVPLWPKEMCPKAPLLCTSDYSPLAVKGDSGGPVFFHMLRNGAFIKAFQFAVIVQVHRFSKYNFNVPLYPYCGWISQITKGEANCHIVFPVETVNKFRRSVPSDSASDSASEFLSNNESNIPYFNEENDAAQTYQLPPNNNNDIDNIQANDMSDNEPVPEIPQLPDEGQTMAEFFKENDKADDDDDEIYFLLNVITFAALICLVVLLCCFCKTQNNHPAPPPPPIVTQKV